MREASVQTRIPLPPSRFPGSAQRYTEPDTPGSRLEFQLLREILEMRRHERIRASEEVIEDPEHDPVLHLLALRAEAPGAGLLHVALLLHCAQRHHHRD